MAAPCYCCFHKQKPVAEKATGEMELDDALEELGMLSSITKSRLEFLEEKGRKKRSSNSLSSAPLCVVQMNTEFVTKFSLNSYSASAKSDSEEENELLYPVDCKPIIVNQELRPHSSRMYYDPSPSRLKYKMNQSKRCRHYMYKPYDFPWRSKLEDSVKNIVEAVAAESNASPPNVVSRQDSGNKSNPGSPVKSQKSGTGCSIFRSRSLDDLEIGKLELKEDCSSEAGRAEIDTVSQRISNLHVS